MAEINVKFVSQKISKIRWRPFAQGGLKRSDIFATGSWNNDENKVCLWSVEDLMTTEDTQPEHEPRLLCEAEHTGDVTDLKYMNQDLILTGSSTGTVTVYRQQRGSMSLGVSQKWPSVHYHVNGASCPCTSVTARGDDIVTVGEDGRINILTIENNYPVRTIDRAESCTINDVTFLGQSEVITVNSSGQLKIWDFRQPADEPSKIFLLTGDRVPLHCVDKHPNQPHIVATGGQDGMLCIWDMRQDKFPITLMEAHSADMLDIKFHPLSPDNLFTCSQDGTLWHWDGSSVASSSLGSGGATGFSMMRQSMTPANQSATNTTNPWLASDASKHRIEVTSILPEDNVMPVNSLDIVSNTLLCGTDGEAIYSIRNLSMR